jgi:hypothetical protein
VPHFPRRDAVRVNHGPRARITFADKSHARFRLQRTIEPRHSVRGASSYLDLNELRHYVSPAGKMPRQLKAYVMIAGDLSTYCDMSHTAL